MRRIAGRVAVATEEANTRRWRGWEGPEVRVIYKDREGLLRLLNDYAT